MIIDNVSHATAEQAASSSSCPQNKVTSTATEAPRTQELFEPSEGQDDEDDATVADVILEHVENAVVNFSSSLANAFTSKLRHACITVLKRTESSALQETADTYPYDDDARFLD
ncbi:hypothetical protein CBER1_01642 [Cercospora berteroae]|uniref:Uncharacterized protein n=1 Tax=Cercospora berteroae TaxID=357750 RepID=A0A2S6C7V6_9PEZI|nr:hypothetical protein CBER1_01642 [Cercospora berteroae]